MENDGITKQSDETRLLRKREVAALLSVSPRSVDNLIRRGAIPFVRLGKSVRFVPGSVLAAIKALEISAN